MDQYILKNESKLWNIYGKINKNNNRLNKIEFLKIESNIEIKILMEKLSLPLIVGGT